MRTMIDDARFEIAATAPYVATVALADGAHLRLALPGIGERLLAGRREAGADHQLEVIPPSSEGPRDPTVNPAARVALATWLASGNAGALWLRHEIGLGGDVGLGDVAAASVAGALAAAGLVGRSLALEELTRWSAPQGGQPAGDNPAGFPTAGALAAAFGGGATLDDGVSPVVIEALDDLRVVVVLPAEGLDMSHPDRVPAIGDGERASEQATSALASGRLDLLTTVGRPDGLTETWRSARQAAQDAGAGWVGVAVGGQALLALTSTPKRAGAIRAAAIEAFAMQGVWSRGRAGPMNRRGAWSQTLPPVTEHQL